MSPRTLEQNTEIRAITRSKILDASMKLFTQNGYERTSVNAIAREAKISKGLIYNHFDTKEDIVRGIVDHLMEIGNQMVMPSNTEATPKELLKYAIDNFFKWLHLEISQTSWLLPLAFQIGRYPFVSEMVSKKINFMVSNSTKIFTAMGYEDPERESWFFGALLDGISMDATLITNYDSKKMHTYIVKKYNLI